MLLQTRQRRHSEDISANRRTNYNLPSVNTTRRKSVHFADTKGLALESIAFFSTEKASREAAEQQQFGRITTAFKKLRQANTIGKNVTLLNYKSPIPSKQVLENIQKNNVCLERTYCNRNGVYGRVQVKNLAYEKHVSVRYTFNTWTTASEHKATYIPGASVADTDTFFFHINSPMAVSEQKMEFAISYKVEGQTFWDNNFGDNYRLLLPP